MSKGFSKPVEIVFTAKVDGSSQRYVETRPEGFDVASHVHLMIALHGHDADRWQYILDERDECRASRDAAARHKMLFVSPDYRAETSWMGPKAEADVIQIIEELRSKYKIGKVCIVGASMGGSSALTFAALHPELVDGVCSQNAIANHMEYDNFQDAIADSFGGTKQDIPWEYKKRSAEYSPEKLIMPIAFTCGGMDTIVPPDSVIRLANKLEQMGRKVLMINRMETGHTTDYEDTTAALEWLIEQVLFSVPKREG